MPRFCLLLDRVQDGLLIATNCSDEDIPAGAVLTSLYALRYWKEGDHLEQQPFSDAHAVLLTIETVEKFGKQFDAVVSGYSAAIRVFGSGIEEIKKQLSAKTADVQLFLGGG